MTGLQKYLADEVALDHVDGLISRREALRRLGLLGVGAAVAGPLLAACAREEAAKPQATTTTAPAATTAARPASVPTQAITFPGPAGEIQGAWAPASDAKGGVLVIHENRGLTDHNRDVAGRFAAAGYSALAIDLLSREGGTEELGGEAEAMAALGAADENRFVPDMKAGLTEIAKRVEGKKLAVIGFCFGGGMVWRLLDSPGEPRLAAAAPFYGPAPDDPDFSGSKAAVLGVYAALDDRVNASRPVAEAALKEAGLTHEIAVFPGVDHAFFNDTGGRYNAEQATAAYQRVLAWFGKHVG